MKFFKYNHLFMGLLLLSITNNSNTMERWTPSATTIVAATATLIGAILLGKYAWDTLLQQPSPIFAEEQSSSPFTVLPTEINGHIIKLVAAGATGETLVDSALAINALAQVDQQLNALINDPAYSFSLVKHLVKRFRSSEEAVCLALSTKEAKNYLATNLWLKSIKIVNNPDAKAIIHALTQRKMYINFDINFRFIDGTEKFPMYYAKWGSRPQTIPGGGNLLMSACFIGYNRLIFHLLRLPDIDINLPNSDGQTALMLAADYQGHDYSNYFPGWSLFYLLQNPHLNINQQDWKGNSALLKAIQPKISVATVYGAEHIQITKLLLIAGADPELANFEGLTPLQAAINSDNQDIIQLIQEAIVKKHETQ